MNHLSLSMTWPYGGYWLPKCNPRLHITTRWLPPQHMHTCISLHLEYLHCCGSTACIPPLMGIVVSIPCYQWLFLWVVLRVACLYSPLQWAIVCGMRFCQAQLSLWVPLWSPSETNQIECAVNFRPASVSDAAALWWNDVSIYLCQTLVILIAVHNQ